MISAGPRRISRKRPPLGGHPIITTTFLLMTMLLSARTSMASWTPQYYIFDRMTWSPDGKTLGVIGRYWNRSTGVSFEDTLTVDLPPVPLPASLRRHWRWSFRAMAGGC